MSHYGHSVLKLSKKGWTAEEIAEVLGVDVQTVNEHMAAGSTWTRLQVEDLQQSLLNDPRELTCPISLILMEDPVLASDTCTYERESIEAHLRNKQTSPMTNASMDRRLTPNGFARSEIASFRERVVRDIFECVPSLIKEGFADVAESLLQRASSLLSRPASASSNAHQLQLLRLQAQVPGELQAARRLELARQLLDRGEMDELSERYEELSVRALLPEMTVRELRTFQQAAKHCSGPAAWRDAVDVLFEHLLEVRAAQETCPLPPGVIVLWSGAVGNVPHGWKLCDGRHGTPDLRDRFVMGAGGARRSHRRGGAERRVLGVEHLPPHSHQIGHYGWDRETLLPRKLAKDEANWAPDLRKGRSRNYTGDFETSKVGAAKPVDMLPPFYTLAYIMKERDSTGEVDVEEEEEEVDTDGEHDEEGDDEEEYREHDHIVELEEAELEPEDGEEEELTDVDEEEDEAFAEEEAEGEGHDDDGANVTVVLMD